MLSLRRRPCDGRADVSIALPPPVFVSPYRLAFVRTCRALTRVKLGGWRELSPPVRRFRAPRNARNRARQRRDIARKARGGPSYCSSELE